jgi:excisionase family DNA binding protein
MARTSTPAPERHLTVPELAARLQVPVETIYGWNRTGKGPEYLRVGRHVRYRLTDVITWENSRTVSRADRWA